MMNNDAFLDNFHCRKLFWRKEIFVFGTGIDAEQAQKELSQYATIVAYIDNNRYGEGHHFYGRDIISLEQCLNRRNKGQPIIIATYKFAMEIYRQMAGVGLLPAEDFFIWDDVSLFHSDMNTKNYICFLNSLWKQYRRNNSVRKVLVPFDNRHDLLSIICAYCANHFAEKFDASIYGYFRFGACHNNASKVMLDIYKAFNMETLIDTELSEEQRVEAQEICDSIWKNLLTWEDWKNITIYGICFGTTIIRYLLRVYIPCFDFRDKKMYSFLRKEIQTIVFWHHYIFQNDIKVVLLADGVTWDGYIRDIAITKGIPTYALCCKMKKMTLDYCDRTVYPYFKEMWNQLTPYEQRYGMKWAKEHIEKRLHGETEDVRCADRYAFAFAENSKDEHLLEKNEKIKVMICPHIFEEDCFGCGEQIFDNNYFSWLCHLGELSNKTPDYDWYLKMHPTSQRRDFVIIDMLLTKYPKIKKLPLNVSPIQLKEEGIDYALTVYGSIGHEYPEIGIQVINAGLNPHSAFDFTWNPKTKEEYDDLIMRLEQLKKKTDMEGLYQFYSLNYLFYDWDYIPYRTLFFENPLLAMDRIELEANGKKLGTWSYKEYMKEWTQERHEKIWTQLEGVFKKLDEWKPDVLYKRKINMDFIIQEEENGKG